MEKGAHDVATTVEAGATAPMAVVDRMYQCFAQGDMATLKSDVFAPDIEWALPGHHPLSGVKLGADEVIAFFALLMQTGISVDNISFGEIGDDRVVETHSGHGNVDGREFLFPTCSVYTIRNGRIARVQVYTADQHGVDAYFWRAYELKPLPDRLESRQGGDQMEGQAGGPMAVVDRMYQCFAQGDMETLKTDVFAGDIEWALPGHHPLSGVKKGADEVIAFFGALMETGINVDNLSFGTIGDDRVVETHSGHGRVDGQEYLFPTCSVYTIRDGKIAHVQVYTADQHGVDDYFWRAYSLKPLPERLTH
jgi:ketosteroid isomerase-like protein